MTPCRSLTPCRSHVVLHVVLRDSGSSEGIDMVKQLYIQAISSLPHRHIGTQDGPPCTPCSIFAQNLYVNAGLFFLESGQFDLAEELLSAARWFAPGKGVTP